MIRAALAYLAAALMVLTWHGSVLAQTNVVYVNGIQNTLEDAAETTRIIGTILTTSVNHNPKKTFSVTAIWNPIGWYGVKDGLDLQQDLMELFLLKTAEEKYARDFLKIMGSGSIDQDAAALVHGFLDDMTPGNNSLESDGKISDTEMAVTKEAANQLLKRIKRLGVAVVVAHSQGNLLANLAYAGLAAEFGDDVNRKLRIVNVANTSVFSVHNLNFTHAGDAALFSAATSPLAIAAAVAAGANAGAADQSLETLPGRFRDWTRTTPFCPGDLACNFSMSPATFSKPTSPLDVGVVDQFLHHSIVETYLSTATVDVLRDQGVTFTPGANRFQDRFEDFLYAAADSLAVRIASIQCSPTNVGQSMACTAAGQNLPNGLVFSAPGCVNIAESSGGTSNTRAFTCTPAVAGAISVVIATDGGRILLTREVSVTGLACPAPQVLQNGVCTPGPDLVVQNLTFGPASVAPGGAVQIMFAVTNAGTTSASASNAVVRINQSTLTPAGTNLATISVPALGAGASVVLPAAFVTAPAVPGSYRVWVIADNNGSSGQGDAAIANDIVLAAGTLTVAQPVSNSPDLVVQNLTFAPGSQAPGGDVQILFAVTNAGTASAAASNAVVRINQSTTSAAGANLATVSVPALAAGASVGLPAASAPAPTTPGLYRVWVIVDNNSTSGQSATAAANDVVLASGTLTVTAPGTVSPDLVVQTISFTPGTVVPGGSVQVNWTLTNQGNATAAASNTVVRINQSATSAAGGNLATVSVPSLGAGASILANAAVIAPTTAGAYQVWVLADSSGTSGQTAAGASNDALLASGTLTVSSAPGAGAPGGLYVGYYAEDPVTNPEDPTPGALYLQLPAGSTAFAGAMYFTFAGCQSANVGAISGTKTDTALDGTWSGTVDGSGQSGAYSGSFNANGGFFAGTYTVAGGKQFQDIPGCIQYFIAPGGTWEIAPVGTSVPSTFTLNGAGTRVNWTSPAGAALTLLSVIDEAVAVTGSPNAAVYQTLIGAGAQLFDLSSVGGLVIGRTYVVTVTAMGGGGQRVGVASIRMTR
ncbi:CARDB domain-containing protein [Caenimonas soli]|uniref:CARDB domain-containing protein n=1 Tax=Caenimonas soli TaxID=2735555 RepID=UPI00155728EF|nr:CARDB domain-containing protein [Caenimonas soli]NPC56658.1 hypothetical protein [Caenimonas soli]